MWIQLKKCCEWKKSFFCLLLETNSQRHAVSLKLAHFPPGLNNESLRQKSVAEAEVYVQILLQYRRRQSESLLCRRTPPKKVEQQYGTLAFVVALALTATGAAPKCQAIYIE